MPSSSCDHLMEIRIASKSLGDGTHQKVRSRRGHPFTSEGIEPCQRRGHSNCGLVDRQRRGEHAQAIAQPPFSVIELLDGRRHLGLSLESGQSNVTIQIRLETLGISVSGQRETHARPLEPHVGRRTCGLQALATDARSRVALQRVTSGDSQSDPHAVLSKATAPDTAGKKVRGKSALDSSTYVFLSPRGARRPPGTRAQDSTPSGEQAVPTGPDGNDSVS